tara:strand:+ start:112 stop:579 length:468 start_codon:yes stop_codon:yes gene_type:complete
MDQGVRTAKNHPRASLCGRRGKGVNPHNVFIDESVELFKNPCLIAFESELSFDDCEGRNSSRHFHASIDFQLQSRTQSQNTGIVDIFFPYNAKSFITHIVSPAGGIAYYIVAKGGRGLIYPHSGWEKNHTMNTVPDFTVLVDFAICWFRIDSKGL